MMLKLNHTVEKRRPLARFFHASTAWSAAFILSFTLFARAQEMPASAADSQVSAAIPNGETVQTENQLDAKNSMMAVMRSGNQYAGKILYADDSLFVIWKSNKAYDPQKLSGNAAKLPIDKIERIVILKKSYAWQGTAYGFLFGGTMGAMLGLVSNDDALFSRGEIALFGGVFFGACGALISGVIGAIAGIDDDYAIQGDARSYTAIVPNLKKEAIFPYNPPPGLQFVQSLQDEESAALPAEPAPRPGPVEAASARLHVSVGGALVMTAANNSMSEAFSTSGFGGTVDNWFFGGTTEYPIDDSAPFAWDMGAEYNLTHKFRLGLAVSKIPQQSIKGTDYEYEYAHGTLYSLLVEYVPCPVSPLLTSRLEFAMGAGLGYNALSVDGTLSAMFGSAIIERPVSFAAKKNSIGLHLRGSLDYYISRNVSLQFKSEARFISSIDVPAVNHTNPYSNEVKTLKRHSVDFSAIDFSLDLRFHF
jgi:hypothetical protein